MSLVEAAHGISRPLSARYMAHLTVSSCWLRLGESRVTTEACVQWEARL